MASKLNPKQLQFIKHFIATGNARQSAIAAGYGPANASKRASILLNGNPLIRAEVQKHRKELTEATKFGYQQAMDQAQKVYELAERTGNAMACAKAVELKSKLSGLLIERHQVQQASLTIVIERTASAPTDEPVEIDSKDDNSKGGQ